MGPDDPTHWSFFTPESLERAVPNHLQVLEAFTYPVPLLWRVSFDLARGLAFRYGDNIHLLATPRGPAEGS